VLLDRKAGPSLPERCDIEIGITRCPETLDGDQVWNRRRW
jgi:hypothetical protein